MEHITGADLASPGFRVLLAENRQVRRELSELRYELARLVGYYERDGSIPVDNIDELLMGEELAS